MQQKFLTKRVEGSKFIDLVCNQAILQPAVELRQQLVSELKEAKILDEFFSKTKVHHYLIQNCEGFFKIMIKQQAILDEDLDMIWSNVSLNEDTRVEFYKVISGVSVEGADQLKFFIDRIIGDNSFGVKSSEIDLFVSISRKMMQADARDNLVTP